MTSRMSARMNAMRANPRAGFSLVELLVVIIIIAIVIAIIVPALDLARTAARQTATAALLNNVTNASMQFSQDNGGRLPGYFEPYEIGAASNEDRGLSAMENVMLDLNGQAAIVGTAGPSGGGGQSGNIVEVGPQAGAKGRNVLVDLDLIGTGNTYFNPDSSNYVAQPNPSQVGRMGHAAPDDRTQLKDLVDAFSNPLLAWVEDPTAPKEVTAEEDFGRRYTSRGERAKFYWASNAAFLQSTAMGKSGKDQTTQSLLADPREATTALAAALGNPSFPTPQNFDDGNVLPGAPRGRFMVQSAGADGVFLGMKDDGAKSFGIASPADFVYSLNFFRADGSRHTDSSGKATTLDLMGEFDDLMSTAGN